MDINQFITDYLDIRNEELRKIVRDEARILNVRRGEILVHSGQIQKDIYFVISGVLRGYFIGADGRELTDCFCCKAGLPAMAGHRFGMPSIVTLEAATDSKVIVLPVRIIDELLKEHIELLQLYNRLLTDSFDVHWKVRHVMQLYPAKERYLWFLEEYPGLIDQVPNVDIASFLNMTPVTLSRIRGQIRKEAEK